MNLGKKIDTSLLIIDDLSVRVEVDSRVAAWISDEVYNNIWEPVWENTEVQVSDNINVFWMNKNI